PNSSVEVKVLAQASSSKSNATTDGVFQQFMNLFDDTAEKRKSREGGIRRDNLEEDAPEELYWKHDGKISFDQAFALYESKSYARAITALHAFIDQNPKSEDTKFATFALGHSYLMANNPTKAKEIFENFISTYPNDALKIEAEKVVKMM
ncbi:MAG: tetratricopeptide repeat protein, partial [Flavobacteriales bacterium]